MSAYYNEWDKKTAAWLRELIKEGLIADGIVDERSICDVQPSDIDGFTQHHFFAGIGGWSYALRLSGWPDSRPVWTASLPCGPWSDAGNQLGEEDARHLAPQFLALTKVFNPPVIFGEQVASETALQWLDGLFFHLENQGYTCAAADLCAAGVGTSHARQRLFWAAYSDSFGVPGLEQAGYSCENGQGWTCSQEDLHAFIDRPFMDSAR